MPRRHELRNAAWERIASLVPPFETNGTYYKHHGAILNGVLFRLLRPDLLKTVLPMVDRGLPLPLPPLD
jgi:hypothetical protein